MYRFDLKKKENAWDGLNETKRTLSLSPLQVDVIQRSSGTEFIKPGKGWSGCLKYFPLSFCKFCPSLLSSSAFCGKLRTWNKPRWSCKDSITNGYTNSSCHKPKSARTFPDAVIAPKDWNETQFRNFFSWYAAVYTVVMFNRSIRVTAKKLLMLTLQHAEQCP